MIEDDDSARDRVMMARALVIARQSRFIAAPNPHVGCLLVKGDTVISEGRTQYAGEAHAEIMALRAAGPAAAGATVYVTLEPCSHHGRTPPCTDALIEAGVARVVAAMEDPNPRVSGRGLQRLREAGIRVECGLLAEQAEPIIKGFVLRMRRGRGRVRAKLAMSMDGRTAMASGESQWITAAAARADVQRQRAASCAILTGSGTVLADNCALTVRPESFADTLGEAQPPGERQPLRVVLDSRRRVPATARVLSADAPALLLHAPDAPAATLPTHVEQVAIPEGASGLDLTAVMRELATRQCNEILVECGPTLTGALLQAGLIDELILYMAPCIMGSSARPLLQLPLDAMSDKVELTTLDVRRVGEDWRFTLVPSASRKTKE